MDSIYAYTLTREEVSNIFGEYVELPSNEKVVNRMLDKFTEEIHEIVKGNQTTESIISDIIAIDLDDYAKQIAEDRAIEIDENDFDDLVREYIEDGTTFFMGATVEDLNVEDILENITPEYTDCADGTLVNLENVLNGRHEDGREINVFRKIETDELLLVLIS